MNSEWQSLQPQTQQELKNTMNAMQPPQSIEEIKAGLETTEKGGVRQSIRNCLTVFQRDPLLSGAMPSGVCEPEERSPCMNKIDKLDKELEKAREKAAEWQAKIRELEKQKQEEENSQIVQAVRSLKLTPAQLMAFLNDPKNSLTASGHTDPKPEAPEKEDTAHEEN